MSYKRVVYHHLTVNKLTHNRNFSFDFQLSWSVKIGFSPYQELWHEFSASILPVTSLLIHFSETFPYFKHSWIDSYELLID